LGLNKIAYVNKINNHNELREEKTDELLIY